MHFLMRSSVGAVVAVSLDECLSLPLDFLSLFCGVAAGEDRGPVFGMKLIPASAGRLRFRLSYTLHSHDDLLVQIVVVR